MRYSIIIPAIFAAVALAAPAPAVHYVTDVKIVKVTVTAGTAEATAAAAGAHRPHGHKHKPKKPANVPAPVQTYAPAPIPVATYTAAPAPVQPKPVQPKPVQPKPVQSSPSSGGDSSIPKSGGVSVLDTFNKYRSKYGLPPATWSAKLAANAYETGKGGDGHEQKHILPTLTEAGSCAQVITPGADEAISGYGDFNPFEVAMLSWLCEVSTDPEISADCPSAVKANAMTFMDTAHHDDLVNPTYNQVGIAFFPNPNADASTPWRGLWVASLES